jgi:SAM-dependent methyltransferase
MSADFEQLRTKMVDGQLRTTDVTNLSVLDAFLSVPREAFVPARLRELAYIDEDVDITPPDGDARRFLMEPSPLAKLIQLAEVDAGDVVLDVGTGTGYSAAILSQLAGSVIALESDATLAAQASERLSELGCDNVAVVEGVLEAGLSVRGALRRHSGCRRGRPDARRDLRADEGRRPSRHRRGPWQCRRGAALPQAGRACFGALGVQRGGEALARFPGRARVRVLARRAGTACQGRGCGG